MPRTKPHRHDNAVTSPIWTSAAFYFESSDEARLHREGKLERGRYGRYDNPSWLEVEERLAALEGVPAALLFPSGMSAIATLTLALVRSGDAIIYTRCGYRNIPAWFEAFASAAGVQAVGIDQGDQARFEAGFEEAYAGGRCSLVFVEMPSNPHQFLVDLDAISARVDRRRTLLVVDGTFASPFNMRPAEHGADLVVHSCTKYLSGDGDLVAGCVAGARELVGRVRACRDVTGAIPSGFTAYLLNRSLDTFELRMRHANAEGLKLARTLEAHPLVERVHHTGLAGHPQAALARRYLRGHGGVLAVELALGMDDTARLVDRMALPFMGSNFGCHAAMVEQCAPFTYGRLTAEERAAARIPDSLLRLSVGRHTADELMEDFRAAAAHLPAAA